MHQIIGDGDSLRAGGSGIGGTGGVQRHVDKRECDRETDIGEDTGKQRHTRVLLSGPLHLPRQAHRCPHRPLYGRRNRRKLVSLSLSSIFLFLFQYFLYFSILLGFFFWSMRSQFLSNVVNCGIRRL